MSLYAYLIAAFLIAAFLIAALFYSVAALLLLGRAVSGGSAGCFVCGCNIV